MNLLFFNFLGFEHGSGFGMGFGEWFLIRAGFRVPMRDSDSCSGSVSVGVGLGFGGVSSLG
jgi:hypothetical protein